MDELTLDNKKYLSSKRAAQITGYAKDYVGQLCREGRIEARLVGRNWYVLESSILEHRFGAEEADEEQKTEKAPLSTWNAPVYTPEVAPVVPTIAPKPAPVPAPASPSVAESAKVLSDMRTAWQEWAVQQEQSEPLLPDGSDMLLEAGIEDTPTTEELPEAPVAIQEDNFPVRIERIQNEPVEAVRAAPVASELYHEPVPVTRRYVDVAPAGKEETPKARLQKKSRAPRRVRTRKEGSSMTARAVFLSVAGLAIAVAIIGSGAADRFMVHGGPFSQVTDFIGGVHTFSAR